MALAHTKIYNFRHFEVVGWDHSTASNNQEGARRNWIALRDMFVGLGWKVRSSSDGGGNFGNNDDVDHFTDQSVLTRTGSNKIWIVVEAPVALGQFQVLYYTSFSTGTSWLGRIACLGSISGGFGAAGGGVDGTAVNVPTATDQHTAFTDKAISDDASVATNYTWHAAESTDGEHLVIFQTAGYELRHLFCCQKVANASPNLDGGVIWYSNIFDQTLNNQSPSETVMDNADHYNTAAWRGKILGSNYTFFLGGRGYNNTALNSKYRVLNDKKMIVSPCDLYQASLSVQGYYGTLIDIYYGADDHFLTLLGDTVGGAANWFSGGSLLIPWDNTEPNVRRR